MDKLQMVGITLWALAVGILGLFAELCVIDLLDDLNYKHGKSKKYKSVAYRGEEKLYGNKGIERKNGKWM